MHNSTVQVESSNNASVDPAKAIKQAQSEISIIRLESSEVEDGVYEREGKIDEEKPKRGRKSLHSKFGKNKYKIVPEEEHPLISSKSVETEQEGDGSEEGENRNGKTKAIPILKQLSMESLEDGLIQQSMISAMDRRSIRDFQTIDEAAEHGQITENRVGSIDPDCRWIQAWNVFIMCIVAYQVLEIPYHISFGYSGSAVGVLVVNYMTDTIFIVAMYLKTRLGYYDTGLFFYLRLSNWGGGVECLKPLVIKKNTLKNTSIYLSLFLLIT